MRADTLAEILIVFGLLLVAAAEWIWTGIALALLVLGLGAVGAGVIIARGGIGK